MKHRFPAGLFLAIIAAGILGAISVAGMLP
jgi:hypothetical protein